MTVAIRAQALFLCRTPLQARICLEILASTPVGSFDLLYLTHDDDEADRTYYDRLAQHASAKRYVHVRPRKPDILNHIVGMWRALIEMSPRHYKQIYLGSIDSLVFQFIASLNPESDLYSFDDGTANIYADSVYRRLNQHKKALLYARLLRAPTPRQIRNKVKGHFSIYPEFENIVAREKITYLSLFSSRGTPVDKAKPTFFIGQPFMEDLPEREVKRIAAWLKTQRIDHYVRHPRESTPIVDHIPVLDKRGELAEDAIFREANGRRPIIIAGFSTVLFNISPTTADKTYVSASTGSEEALRQSLVQQAGASVLSITETASLSHLLNP
jgi:beta-galactosamide-alpha-2,3-sialyltransferase